MLHARHVNINLRQERKNSKVEEPLYDTLLDSRAVNTIRVEKVQSKLEDVFEITGECSSNAFAGASVHRMHIFQTPVIFRTKRFSIVILKAMNR